MGADPAARTTDALAVVTMGPAIFNRPRIILKWARHFPQWDWEEREAGVGSTVMAQAVFVGVDKKPAIEALRKVGASVGYCCDNGSTILTNMAANVVSTHYRISVSC